MRIASAAIPARVIGRGGRSGAHIAESQWIGGREVLEFGVGQGVIQHGLPNLGRRARAVHDATVLIENGGGVICGTYPHGSGQLRGGTNHPGILVISGIAHLGRTGLRGRSAAARKGAIGPRGYRLHGLEDVIGHIGRYAALAFIFRVLVQHFAGGVFYALHKVGIMPHTLVSQGGHRGSHIERAGLVLTQDDALEWLLALFRQRLLNARQGLSHTQGMRHIRGVLRTVLQVRLQAQEGGIQGLLGSLAQVAYAAATAHVGNHIGSRQLIRSRRVISIQANSLLQGSC